MQSQDLGLLFNGGEYAWANYFLLLDFTVRSR